MQQNSTNSPIKTFNTEDEYDDYDPSSKESYSPESGDPRKSNNNNDSSSGSSNISKSEQKKVNKLPGVIALMGNTSEFCPLYTIYEGGSSVSSGRTRNVETCKKNNCEGCMACYKDEADGKSYLSTMKDYQPLNTAMS